MKIDWEQVTFIICFIVFVTGLVQCHEQTQATEQHMATIKLQRDRLEAETDSKRLEVINKQQEKENAQKETP